MRTWRAHLTSVLGALPPFLALLNLACQRPTGPDDLPIRPGAEANPEGLHSEVEPAGKIAFTLGPWGIASDIAVINADGSGLTNLTNTPEAEMMGGWSPDGLKIVFERADGPSDFQIWVMNADGSGQTQLTSSPGVRLAPTFSPDGTQIAFGLSTDLTSADADIIVANADGSNPVSITDWPGLDGCPRWSPDGQKILFTSNRLGGTGTDLFLMAPDGSGVQPFTEVKGIELCASWSPDGSQIAYDQVTNRNPGIYIANADGSARHRIHPHGFAAQPWWSPDGEWLVFHQFHGGALDLYLIRPDGSDRRQLTKLREMALNPIWAP